MSVFAAGTQAGGGSLVCPRCERPHDPDEVFCPECGMPLVDPVATEYEPGSQEEAQARKIRPQYARGELRRVAWARNQAEAELIGGMLLEEGIPSLQKRARGFDVPEFVAGGPRELYVPESGYRTAKELLDEHAPEAGVGEAGDEAGRRANPLRPTSIWSSEAVRLMLGILIVLAIGVVIALIAFNPG